MSFWMTPQQIYDALTNGPGSSTLEAAQKVSYDEARAEQERADRIRRLVSTVESGWQGDAADGAQGAARPLAQNAAEGAEYLYLAQDLLDRQAGSFHRAAASVEPMPAEPMTDLLEQVVPFDVDTDAEVRAYQEKAQHNIRVFEGYDNASSHNETYLPRQFSSTNYSGGGISVASAESGDSGGPGNYSAPGGDSGRGEPGGFRPGGAPVVPAAQQPVPVGPPVVPSGGPSGVGGQDRPGGGSGGGPAGPGGGPGGGFGGPGGGPGGGFGPARPGESGRGTGGRGVSGGRGGKPGQGAGLGQGRRSSAGPGGGGGPVRGPLGPGGGVGAGALAAEEAAARRGLTSPRSAGGGMMGGPAGGRRDQEEDQEHTRKVLIETDAESVFGSEVLTAPQVIGDDEYED